MAITLSDAVRVLPKLPRQAIEHVSTRVARNRFAAGKITALLDLDLIDITTPGVTGAVSVEISDNGVTWQFAAGSTWQSGLDAVDRFGDPTPPNITIFVKQQFFYRARTVMSSNLNYGCDIGKRA